MQKNLPIYLGGSILYKAYGNKRIFSAKNPFDVATYIKDHIADYESEFNLRVLEAKGDELQEKQRRNIAERICEESGLNFDDHFDGEYFFAKGNDVEIKASPGKENFTTKLSIHCDTSIAARIVKSLKKLLLHK